MNKVLKLLWKRKRIENCEKAYEAGLIYGFLTVFWYNTIF